MRKQYSAPIVEKVVFDYRVQISTASNCVESVMNIQVGENLCGDGMPISIGWTEPQHDV